ncbi:hypothetical protein DITRI_Ditri03aG0114800 [Diplodiscus trichospermus]
MKIYRLCRVLEGYNNRRDLHKYSGPCQATNPIDRCWGCDPFWAANGKKLASCVLGFGRRTTGGKDCRFYVVTDPSDDDAVNPKPGTIRQAVIQNEPLWITFAHDMVIRLNQELIMASNKTIDGRGADVHFPAGVQITLQYIQNVVIHGIHIRGSVQANGGMIRDSVIILVFVQRVTVTGSLSLDPKIFGSITYLCLTAMMV